MSNSKYILKYLCVFSLFFFLSSFSLQAAVVVIDDFNAGHHHIVDNNGHTDFNFSSDPSIIGGDRQTRVRDGHSGVLGGQVHLRVDNQLSVWGNTAPGWSVHYGTGIDSPFTGNPNTGNDLNLAMGLSSTLDFDVLQNGNGYSVTFITDFGNVGYGSSAVVGSNSVSLLDMGLTADQATSINGLIFSFSGGSSEASAMIVDNLQFSATAVPEPSSLSMMSLSALGLLVYRRRKRN